MRNLLLSSVILLSAVLGYGQDCSRIINDQANVFGDTSTITDAANAISAQGGDAKVITVGKLSGTLEQYVKGVYQSCNSWQSASGGMKNNLVVFALAPSAHTFGIFYGHEMKAVLDGSAAAIKSQYMTPAFRDKDWTRGIVNGEKRVAINLEAFNTAALHPEQHTTTVTNQATDLSGFVKVLFWILGLGAVGLAIFFLYYLFSTRRKEVENTKAAQQEAQKAANDVATKLASLSDYYKEKAALGENVTKQLDTLNRYAESYSKISGGAYDPSTNGLTKGQYENITRWQNRQLRELNELERPTETVKPSVDTDAPSSSYRAVPRHSRWPSSSGTQQPNAPTTVTNNTTTIIHDESYVPLVNPIPIFIDEDRPISPYRPAADPEPEPAYVGHSEEKMSGSSNDWSNSDDDKDKGSSDDFSSDDSNDSMSGDDSSF